MNIHLPLWAASWLIFSVSIFLTAQFLPGIRINGFLTAVWVALVYGVLKFLLFYLLVFVTAPLVILTLGLFLFVINAFLLWLTDKLVEGFHFDGFGYTLLASVVITVLDILLRSLFLPLR